MRLAPMLAVVVLLGVAGCQPAAAPELTADQVFDAICSKCHGADGFGGVPDGTGVAPRNFHDARFQAARTDDALKQVIREGKNGRMPAFGATLSPHQLEGLVARIRSYQPKENQP